MSVALPAVFRSLRSYNYRVWSLGALVSNIGTWMQRTAQDWLVLTELTHNKASAVGVVMALQFGPQLLLLPLTGLAADVFNERKLLLITQALMGLLALALGALTITHLVELWHVYVFAFLFGCVSAFDAPVRQTFVAELVGDEDLVNAVALNSTSFNAARMAGPAIAAGSARAGRSLPTESHSSLYSFLFRRCEFQNCTSVREQNGPGEALLKVSAMPGNGATFVSRSSCYSSSGRSV